MWTSWHSSLSTVFFVQMIVPIEPLATNVPRLWNANEVENPVRRVLLLQSGARSRPLIVPDAKGKKALVEHDIHDYCWALSPELE